MTPPTKSQYWLYFIGCKILDCATIETAIDPKGFGGVMTPPYDSETIKCNLKVDKWGLLSV